MVGRSDILVDLPPGSFSFFFCDPASSLLLIDVAIGDEVDIYRVVGGKDEKLHRGKRMIEYVGLKWVSWSVAWAEGNKRFAVRFPSLHMCSSWLALNGRTYNEPIPA